MGDRFGTILCSVDTGPTCCLAFSPDGKTLASGGDDGVLQFWDVTTYRKRAALRGHTDRVFSVAHSPDGTVLASGSDDRSIRLWNASTGEPQGILRCAAGVASVAFSPDGRTLASGGLDGTATLWDLSTGTERTVVGYATIDSYDAVKVAYSPDGNSLAIMNEFLGDVLLLDAQTAEKQVILRGDDGSVAWVAFSPDGRTLASGSADGKIRLWDAPTGKMRRVLTVDADDEDSQGTCAAFSPDGKTLAVGDDTGCVRLWEVAARGRKPQATLNHDARHAVRCVAYRPDGRRLAAGSEGGAVGIWDVGPEA
jgi:WD40 repeat protein